MHKDVEQTKRLIVNGPFYLKTARECRQRAVAKGGWLFDNRLRKISVKTK